HPPRGCQTIGDRQPGTRHEAVIRGSAAQPQGVGDQRRAGGIREGPRQGAWREGPQQLGTRGVTPLGAGSEHWLLRATIEIIRGESLQERAPLSRARLQPGRPTPSPEGPSPTPTPPAPPDRPPPYRPGGPVPQPPAAA